MFIRLSAKNGVFRLPPIQRENDLELDVAITDLEKRGFYLVRRGTHGKCLKETENKSINNQKPHGRVWAIMEKLM